MWNNRYKILAGLVVALAIFAAGRFTSPSKVVEKEHIVYQDRIVEKKIFVKDTSKKNNIVTIRLVTIKPDGTRTIETKTYDKSEIEIVQKDKEQKQEEKDKTIDKEKTTTYAKNDTFISLGSKIDTRNLTSGINYGLFLNKRVIGPLYMGVFGFTDASGGISLGLGF